MNKLEREILCNRIKTHMIDMKLCKLEHQSNNNIINNKIKLAKLWNQKLNK